LTICFKRCAGPDPGRRPFRPDVVGATNLTSHEAGSDYDFLRSFPYIQRNGNRVERADESELESRPSPCAEFARVEVRIDFERLVSDLLLQQRDVIWGVAQKIPQNLIARGLGGDGGRVSQIKNEPLASAENEFRANRSNCNRLPLCGAAGTVALALFLGRLHEQTWRLNNWHSTSCSPSMAAIVAWLP
jgi:hypothetical protein